MPAIFGETTTRLLQPLAKALREWRQVLCSRQGFSWWLVGELFDGAAGDRSVIGGLGGGEGVVGRTSQDGHGSAGVGVSVSGAFVLLHAK